MTFGVISKCSTHKLVSAPLSENKPFKNVSFSQVRFTENRYSNIHHERESSRSCMYVSLKFLSIAFAIFLSHFEEKVCVCSFGKNTLKQWEGGNVYICTRLVTESRNYFITVTVRGLFF